MLVVEFRTLVGPQATKGCIIVGKQFLECHCNLLTSFGFQRYNPPILAEYINHSEKVFVTTIWWRVWWHVDQISCPDAIDLFGKHAVFLMCFLNGLWSSSASWLLQCTPFPVYVSVQWYLAAAAYPSFHVLLEVWVHSAPLAFCDHNPVFRSRFLDSRYHDAWRLHRLHCMVPSRAVDDLLNPVVDAGDCRVRHSDASVKQKPSSTWIVSFQ